MPIQEISPASTKSQFLGPYQRIQICSDIQDTAPPVSIAFRNHYRGELSGLVDIALEKNSTLPELYELVSEFKGTILRARDGGHFHHAVLLAKELSKAFKEISERCEKPDFQISFSKLAKDCTNMLGAIYFPPLYHQLTKTLDHLGLDGKEVSSKTISSVFTPIIKSFGLDRVPVASRQTLAQLLAEKIDLSVEGNENSFFALLRTHESLIKKADQETQNYLDSAGADLKVPSSEVSQTITPLLKRRAGSSFPKLDIFNLYVEENLAVTSFNLAMGLEETRLRDKKGPNFQKNLLEVQRLAKQGQTHALNVLEILNRLENEEQATLELKSLEKQVGKMYFAYQFLAEFTLDPETRRETRREFSRIRKALSGDLLKILENPTLYERTVHIFAKNPFHLEANFVLLFGDCLTCISDIRELKLTLSNSEKANALMYVYKLLSEIDSLITALNNEQLVTFEIKKAKEPQKIIEALEELKQVLVQDAKVLKA